MIITIANQKGGTGKTTTAAALAWYGSAARKKQKELKTLAIDLDPQCNLTFSLGAESGTHSMSAYELLSGTASIGTIKQPITPYLDVVGGSTDIMTLTGGRGTARALAAALEPIKKKYDLVVIDTPPTSGNLLYNALMASDGVIIPLSADVYSLNGLYQIVNTARLIAKENKQLQVTGAIFTCFDGRSILSRQMKEGIETAAADIGIPVLGSIPNAVTVKEAAALQRSIYEYAPKNKATEAYRGIFDSLFRR